MAHLLAMPLQLAIKQHRFFVRMTPAGPQPLHQSVESRHVCRVRQGWLVG